MAFNLSFIENDRVLKVSQSRSTQKW